jgi:hypothetical protein
MTQEMNGNADTVVQAQFIVEATDGTHTADIHQSVQLKPSTDGAFIPFADLTEAQVIAWVKAALHEGQEAQFEAMLARTIALKANPPVRPMAKPAPWYTCTQA